MTSYAHQGLFRTLSATAVATALAVTVVPAAHAGTAPTASSPPAPALTWRDCAQPGGPAGQECAELPVPLDYSRPDGPQLTLAVSRLRSDRPAARRGALIVIPGGPGGSGVQRLTEKGPRCADSWAARTTSSASIRAGWAAVRGRAAGSTRPTGIW